MPVVVRIGKAALTAMSFVWSIEMAIMVSGKLGAILSAVLSPMGLLTAGIMTLSYMLQQALDGPHGKELRATLTEILAIGREIGLHLMKAFGEFFGWAQGKWGGTFGDMQGASDSLFGTIADWFRYITKQVAIFTADFGLTWELIKESASLAFLFSKDKFNAFVEVGGAKLTLMWMEFQDAAESAFATVKPFAYAFLAAMLEIGKQIGANLATALGNAYVTATRYAQASAVGWAAGKWYGSSFNSDKEAWKNRVESEDVNRTSEQRRESKEKFERGKAEEIDRAFRVEMGELNRAHPVRSMPGFDPNKINKAWDDAKAGAAAPLESDADKARRIARIAEMETLRNLQASTSTTDAEKELIRTRLAGIQAAMEAEREKQKVAQDAKDKSNEFWAEAKRRQQVLGRPEDEGKDGKAAAGKGKGKRKDFGIVDIAQFAKDLQMAIQKSDAEKATEEMAAVIKGAKAPSGKGLNVVIADMPNMVAKAV
jgi:hypothetical protein